MTVLLIPSYSRLWYPTTDPSTTAPTGNPNNWPVIPFEQVLEPNPWTMLMAGPETTPDPDIKRLNQTPRNQTISYPANTYPRPLPEQPTGLVIFCQLLTNPEINIPRTYIPI